MLSILKPKSEKLLHPIAGLFRNVNPNYITLLGLIFPVLFFILLINKQYVPALLIFILNSVDMLDGVIARTQDKVTAFGGFLDSVIDRFADFIIIVAFGFAELVNWDLVLTFALLSFLISYIRSRAELASRSEITVNVGIMERTERLVLLFIGLLLYLLMPNVVVAGQDILDLMFVLLTILSLVTVAQRFIFVHKKLS